MLVTCLMTKCPYWFENNFCSKPIVNIDENGMCKQLWKGGQPRNRGLEPVEENLKRPPAIVEGEYYEQSSEEEETNEISEGVQSEITTEDNREITGEEERE